ncbi:GNAT family N-acetyltransferase [Achromobacter seleniivolatilans]|uniref:GNAT family N-acetyltransferase n=1 Tax=Achromobacter seleniivolatilans TaxID=3047478 RepID=A0ABY9M0D8_9BURK|nr:GNAT family N-acetyltransferase [Achromobacter sp. R39]WMD20469.1 GNAT family N-acetyltransferase [Achromobacter sp. R39]
MTLTHTLALQPATDDDLPFLLALRKSTMQEHLQRAGAPLDDNHHLDRIRYHFDDAHIVWLDGRPAGLFKHYRDQAGWRIVQIQIDPAFQGQGLGRRLLVDVLSQADAEDTPVTLSVLKGNPARRLYESLGFTPVEETDLEFEMRYEPGAVRPAG